MDFKDYYASLGVSPSASQDEIKRAYRKLARKYHPDVSKEPDAEARFKEVAEAHEALIDAERRAAYDDIARRQASGQPVDLPPGWDAGFEFSGRGDDGGADGRSGHPGMGGEDFSEFFEALFGQGRGGGRGRQQPGRGQRADPTATVPGEDHHAKVLIDLLDSFVGVSRRVSLRMPVIDANGRTTLQERQLEVNIPRGVRQGQHLRLSGQGEPGRGGATAGDLYLEIQFRPHPVFRVEGRDLFFELPVSPWEAALGASVTAPTPDGPVRLGIPPGSSSGRKLRLKGKGLPGKEPGDLYAALQVVLPPAESPSAKEAYEALGRAFPEFAPRSTLES